MRFILKHDTIENWERVNPVLMEAEIVSVKEDGFYSLALGDGTNPFKKLPRIKLQEGLSLKLVHYGNGRIRIRAIEDTFREEEKILAKEEKTMSDNYAVINGKRVELTDEQVKALGVEVEKKRRNPFERVNNDNEYYYIKNSGEVSNYCEVRDSIDNELYDNINYFNDEQFAQQVALHQLLYRKLLKFAYDNGYEDGDKISRYYVAYFPKTKAFVVRTDDAFRAPWVYFSSYEGAMRAITEVAEPFMKKHPKFVW